MGEHLEHSFCVQQLDHVELFVPDRYEAADWYERVLGLTILKKYHHWATDPNGPLMISPDAGNTKLALFTGSASSEQRGGYDQVAFRIDGPGFVAFADRLAALKLNTIQGERLSRASVRDHHGAYSFHFCDPWGHRLELTTYECDYVLAHLEAVDGRPASEGSSEATP